MSFLKNRTVVGVICILLSLLICFGLTPLFNQSVSQKAEIVRVVQPIRAGDEITESMVQIVEVGGYNLPEDVLRQKESAVGKYLSSQLPLLRDAKWDTDKQYKTASNVKSQQAGDHMSQALGTVAFTLPHSAELEGQYLAGNLLADLSMKDSRVFRKEIEKIAREVFGC